MKVFISGSIGIKYLTYDITDELVKYMQGELEILIGDAYGVDSFFISLTTKALNVRQFLIGLYALTTQTTFTGG